MCRQLRFLLGDGRSKECTAKNNKHSIYLGGAVEGSSPYRRNLASSAPDTFKQSCRHKSERVIPAGRSERMLHVSAFGDHENMILNCS